MPGRVLSTDPSAGLQQTKRVLSTDPSAGVAKRVLSTDPSAGVREQEEDPTLGFFGRGADLLGRVLSPLSRSGALLAGAANEALGEGNYAQMAKDTLNPLNMPDGLGTFKRTDDFAHVLQNTKGSKLDPYIPDVIQNEGWANAAAGFVADVVTDPLNLLPMGLVSKGVQAVGKGVGKAAHAIPGVNTAVKALEDTFVPFAGLEKFAANSPDALNFKDTLRLQNSVIRHEGEKATEMASNWVGKGLNPTAGGRKLTREEAKQVIYAIDEGRVADLADPRLAQAANEWSSVMAKQAQDKVGMGSIAAEDVLDNYVPYQTQSKSAGAVDSVSGSEFRGKTRSDKARKEFDTLKAAVQFGGAKDDAAELLASHVGQTQKAKRTNDFLHIVGKEFGKDTVIEGGRKLDRKMLNIPEQTWNSLKGKHFPKEIADTIERQSQLWSKPNELDGLYKSSVKMWKSMATSINPGHHFTNFLGNIHNMYVGGMDMTDMPKALRNAYRVTNRSTDAERIARLGDLTVGDKTYKAADLYRLANDYEMLGTSSAMSYLGEEGTNKWVNNEVFKTFRRAGTARVEEPARLAFWLDQIKKGKTPEQAALRTKDVLFDYSELTEAEKTLRGSGMIPFYTWMRKNVPFQFKSMVENPKKVERVRSFADIPWNANETQVDESVIPEQVQHSGFVPGPMAGPNGELVLNRFNLPTADVNRLTDMSTIMDSLGPLPKLLIEGSMNQKSFGGKVTTATGLSAPSPAASMLAALNYVLPKSAEGWITPTEDVYGRPRQRDIPAWIMNTLIPTGVYGSTAKVMQGEDPTRPEIEKSKSIVSKILGTTADVLSLQDQKYALADKKAEWRRKYMQKALLEK